ncbi:hypothetical protein MPSEU_000289700 [Mayamaea pseudoterrestris]|nr:hypothetical protein MPSEU_000289700 [Mayamaea pseudoterrestris]
MYKDLFGDLPEAKKPSQLNSETATAGTNVDEQSGTGSNYAAAVAATTTASEKPHQQNLQSSIVKSVGALGTAVAFVPTAALKRKRHATTSAKASKSSNFATVTSPTNGTLQEPQSSQCSAFLHQQLPEITTVATQEAEAGQSQSLEQKNSDTSPSASFVMSDDHRQRLRQQALDDPYDPLVPNDLLQYWERRAVAADRERLEQERLEHIKEQQDLRQRLEMERRHLEREGNVDKLMENERQRNGRGRGVSNLPAWLLAKQQQEASFQK